MIPNSVVAKAIVTNHRRLNDAHLCTVDLKIHHGVSCSRVLEILKSAAIGCPGLALGTTPVACASGFDDALIAYELTFAIEQFTEAPDLRSELIRRVTDALQRIGIAIGTRSMDIQILRHNDLALERGVAKLAAKPPAHPDLANAGYVRTDRC